MTNTAEESMRRDPGMAKNRNEGKEKDRMEEVL